ncbi:MAG: hypothetical protein HC860_26880 [Alkalinema sp. RU_4_3]|nr:hypothetical protein [Alkalinema sp. RU_4_3]
MNDAQILPLFRLRLLNLLDCQRVRHLPRPDVFCLFWRRKGKLERRNEERGRGRSRGLVGEGAIGGLGLVEGGDRSP